MKMGGTLVTSFLGPFPATPPSQGARNCLLGDLEVLLVEAYKTGRFKGDAGCVARAFSAENRTLVTHFLSKNFLEHTGRIIQELFFFCVKTKITAYSSRRAVPLSDSIVQIIPTACMRN